MESLIADKMHNAILVLSDGKYFIGTGVGTHGEVCGEICFNTGLTGYQETITDPSYANQIITFTFPHIGNVGCNLNDMEKDTVRCSGIVIANKITSASNYRSLDEFNTWLIKHKITGVANIDTRELTRYISKNGGMGALIVYAKEHENIDIAKLQNKAKTIPDLDQAELTTQVSTCEKYIYNKGRFDFKSNAFIPLTPSSQTLHVVVIDYGVKDSILDCLVASGCHVTVVNSTVSASTVLGLNPDGIFLSNGPGDPAATYQLVKDTLQELIATNIPIFGICMGHQLLGMAFNLATLKMHQGHRGANHPVKNLITGKVEITSQNHGFCVEVDENKLSENIRITHISLFDRTLEGFEIMDKPIFAVQYHPESSPGPIDSRYLFTQFVENMKKVK